MIGSKLLRRNLLGMLNQPLHYSYKAHHPENAQTEELPQQWRANFETRQEESAYILEVELPGVEEEHIDIKVKDKLLRIVAEKKRTEKSVTEEGKEESVEKVLAKYEDAFKIPEDADKENIGAAYKNGLLTITVPKAEEKIVERKITLS